MRHPQHLVSVAAHAGPVHVADTVDDFCRTRPAAHQVTTMHDKVNADLFQIRDHRLQCGEVGVDIGDNRDSHRQRGAPYWSLRVGTRLARSFSLSLQTYSISRSS